MDGRKEPRLSPFVVSPPAGDRHGCLDAIILNMACFTAIPSGLLTVIFIAGLLPEWVGRDYGLGLAFGVGVPAIVGFGLFYYRLLYAIRRWIRQH